VPPNPKATCQAEFSGICPGKNPLAQRNYPADSFILTYFPGLVDLNETGASAFKKQLYLAVLAQGIEMKADITARRSNNHWGTGEFTILTSHFFLQAAKGVSVAPLLLLHLSSLFSTSH
jgi:hypothetical protein